MSITIDLLRESSPKGFEFNQYDDYIGVQFLTTSGCWFIISIDNDSDESVINVLETGKFDEENEYEGEYTIEEFITILEDTKDSIDDTIF